MENSPVARIGVIGDVHAEHERLSQALEFLAREAVDTVLCTGDLVDGPGCVDQCVNQLAEHKVRTVRGNHDRWILEDKARHIPNAHHPSDLHDATLAYLQDLPKTLELDSVSGKLLLCHGMGKNDLRKIWPGTERMPVERSHELDRIIDTGKYQFIINGHVHFKTMMHFRTLTLINAGTISGDRWTGFTILDFEQALIETYTFAESGITLGKTTPIKTPVHHEPWQDTQCFSGDWEPLLLFDRG